jgi:hypothetical protein
MDCLIIEVFLVIKFKICEEFVGRFVIREWFEVLWVLEFRDFVAMPKSGEIDGKMILKRDN